ncbi:MAG: hypothetical protein PVG25_04105, partial [Anaerolineae bacterium]
MNTRERYARRYALVALICAVGLILTLLWILGSGGRRAAAASALSRGEEPPGEPALTTADASGTPAVELHVCPSGCPYSSVQTAVDAANAGDVIKVAVGTYTGVSSRPIPPGYNIDVSGSSVVTQVVYVNKTVTIQGGYTTANWTTPDPVANPTVLDAQRQGRVLL